MEMELTILDQTISFFYSVLTGVVSGLIYELFAGIKNVFLKNKILKDITDILFVLTLFVFLIFSFFSICGLGFRIFHIAGLFLGAIIFFLTVGGFFYKVFEKILKIFKFFLKILLYPLKLCYIIVMSIIRRIVSFFRPFFCRISLLYAKTVVSIKRIAVRRGKI